MKQFVLALCAAANLCTTSLAQSQPKGAATSLDLNPHGIGHMLVVPYFSTQGGNATLLNLFNATNTSKAVKIRFRGAGNGDELFSLQVFLWQHDAWTVNIATGANGLPVLTTVDRSCTLPAGINGAQFSTARLNPALTGDALANQAREGYIEIIAMGDIADGTALKTAITPSFGTPPCTPSVLGALTRFDPQLTPPTTGLIANWILINVPQTTTWSGEAVAYEARLNGVASTGNNVFFPQTTAPLSGTDVSSYSSDPLYNFASGGPIVAPVSSNLPDLSTPHTSNVTTPQNQVTALSLPIAARETVVEYLTDPTIQASTDWVLSMPTRRYHAAVDYRGPTLITNGGTFGNAQAVYFTRINTSPSASGQSCYTDVALSLLDGYNREGAGTTLHVVPSYPVTFCGVVSVLGVNGDTGSSSPALRAAATRTRLEQPDAGTDGHTRLLWSKEGAKGLPVLVRQFARAVNPSVSPGISGTFGATTAGRMVTPGVSP